jgi:N-acetylneuraminate lyase
MAKVCRLVDILFRYGGVAAGKAMMAVHGLDLGDVRLPLKALTAADKSAIVAEVAEILGIA